MRRLLFALAGMAAIAAAVGVTAGLVYASNYQSSLTMDEAQAMSTCNPNPAPANGGGKGTILYNSNTNLLSWRILHTNLSGPAIAAHFHGPANPGVDAGIQVTIDHTQNPSAGSMTITDGQETQLLANMWYVNYHTTACAGGEVRGQVLISGAKVGGIAELAPVDSAPAAATGASGVETATVALIAGSATAAVLMAGGGMAWYARRRSAR
jgi:hypothetical protein